MRHEIYVLAWREDTRPKPRPKLTPEEAAGQQQELVEKQTAERAALEVVHQKEEEALESAILEHRCDASTAIAHRQKLAKKHEARREGLLEDQASSRESLINVLQGQNPHLWHNGIRWRWLGRRPSM